MLSQDDVRLFSLLQSRGELVVNKDKEDTEERKVLYISPSKNNTLVLAISGIDVHESLNLYRETKIGMFNGDGKDCWNNLKVYQTLRYLVSEIIMDSQGGSFGLYEHDLAHLRELLRNSGSYTISKDFEEIQLDNMTIQFRLLDSSENAKETVSQYLNNYDMVFSC